MITPNHISIFKSLFRGRQDVFPIHWESTRNGHKSGFSPACENKFKEGCGLKSGSKCYDCTVQKFAPLTDPVYKNHLIGQQLIGIYPLLQDNTCFFIAVDFDNHENDPRKAPLQEAKDFSGVCSVQEIPCFIERSKSGNGFHVWIFFNDFIPAWKARLVTIALLQEAQVIDADEPDSDSSSRAFDRIFPNQDELSGKGLGNLIALPLYGKAFKQGNSTYLDKDYQPITDERIWDFLNSIERVSEGQLDQIIDEWKLTRETLKEVAHFSPSSSTAGSTAPPLSPAPWINPVIERCKFIQHCRDNQATLSEPLWYDMVSNLARFEGSRQIVHEFSGNYPGYTPAETDAKIDHASSASNPITCQRIKKDGFDCGQTCGVKSPAGLGAKFSKGHQENRKRLPSPTPEFISSCHQALLSNPSLFSKWDLTQEIVSQRSLGIFEEGLVFPYLDRSSTLLDAYWYKEGKVSAFSGKPRLLLLPSDMLLRKESSQDPLILCDSFSDFLSALSHGFAAITTTFGRAQWSHTVSDSLRGKNIILIATNAEESKNRVISMGKQLSGVAKTVKAFTAWPEFIQPGEGLRHFMAKKGADRFQAIIDLAPKVTANVKELAGITFIEPPGYTVTADQVEYETEYKGITIPKTLCFTGVIISGRAIDVDIETEEVEICFHRDNQWRRISDPRRTFMDKSKILALSDRGFPVNSNNAPEMVKFLAEFESANIERIPKNFIASGCGWKSIRGHKLFVLGDSIIGLSKNRDDREPPKIIIKTPPGFENFEKALRPAGSFSKWAEVITSVLKYPIVSFAFYSSFAASIIPVLKAANFILHIWGLTSTGKTTCLEACSSGFGNPTKENGGLIVGWNSTKVYAEYISSYFNHCPIFLDDCQMASDKDLERILYMIANGLGKGRAKPDGVRPTKTWNTVCLSNGEKPLTDCTNFGGARARTIELYGAVFPGATGGDISDVKAEIKKNYGHAGRKFLKSLLPLLEDKKEVEKLEKEWRRYQRDLTNEANCEVGDRMAWYFATTKVTADLVTRLVGIGSASQAEENISRLFKQSVVNSETHSDIAARAMEHILSWARGNRNSFESGNYDTSPPKWESFGVWSTGEFIAIRKHKLEKELMENNFGTQSILKMWAERGWIRHTQQSFTWVVFSENAQKRERMVCIPWEAIEQLENTPFKKVKTEKSLL